MNQTSASNSSLKATVSHNKPAAATEFFPTYLTVAGMTKVRRHNQPFISAFACMLPETASIELINPEGVVGGEELLQRWLCLAANPLHCRCYLIASGLCKSQPAFSAVITDMPHVRPFITPAQRGSTHYLNTDLELRLWC